MLSLCNLTLNKVSKIQIRQLIHSPVLGGPITSVVLATPSAITSAGAPTKQGKIIIDLIDDKVDKNSDEHSHLTQTSKPGSYVNIKRQLNAQKRFAYL